jgi:putative FmdB family regulatory protein
MPVYTYRCDNCGVQLEKHQKFSDQPLTTCPECGKKALKKVYQPVGIVFKGSGFYATDHHSPSGQQNKKSEENKDGGESKEPSSQAATPKDSKSDVTAKKKESSS